MVSAAKDPLSFDELMATPIDFSNIELEYNMEECFKALTDILDWNNPEGDRYPLDLTKPLPLKGCPGRLNVAAEYFFNNDLEFQKSSDPEKKYTTSITKTKAARYEIVGIKDMVPTLWSANKVRSQINKISKPNVYSTQKILSVVSVSVKKMHGYGYLKEIVVRRADCQVYKFKEGDLADLYLNDNEDMLLLSVQHKRVEDLQLGVESYQKKLNITAPQKTFPEIEFKELYTPSYKPPGVIYEDLNKQKRVTRADDLYKFSYGTLKTVRDELHHRILDFRLGYNKEMSMRKWITIDKRRSELMVKLMTCRMRERTDHKNLERLSWCFINVLVFVPMIQPEPDPRDIPLDRIDGIFDKRMFYSTLSLELLILKRSFEAVKTKEGYELVGRAFGVNERYFEDCYSKDQYVVSIKEDTAYPCMRSPKTTEDNAQYAISRETQCVTNPDNSGKKLYSNAGNALDASSVIIEARGQNQKSQDTKQQIQGLMHNVEDADIQDNYMMIGNG
ncbi:hypothetical protein Tco_1202387 [Tanacetum coccineum]